MIQLLLKNVNLDLNVTDDLTGVNAFWLACFYGHGLIMKELANAGADVFNVNKEGINVLHLSIYMNNKPIVKMLLLSNFPLEYVTDKGYSAIHLCCMLNRTDILHEIMTHMRKSGYNRTFKRSLLNSMNN